MTPEEKIKVQEVDDALRRVRVRSCPYDPDRKSWNISEAERAHNDPGWLIFRDCREVLFRPCIKHLPLYVINAQRNGWEILKDEEL